MRDKLKLLETYLKFQDKAIFVDIETEGLSKERNDITLIGICKDGRYFAFIKNLNLEKALNFLSTSPIWITFGGENFDLPFIKKTFQSLEYPEIHLDLFHYTRLLGLRGGLKKIEKELGIERKTEGFNGYTAVKLWRKWIEERDRSALRKLILYNREDVLNLKIVLDYIIEFCYKKSFFNIEEGNL
ncbi:MAG: ribonuclease H-like domain-containing protein [Caldimicrobium thiodismutans]